VLAAWVVTALVVALAGAGLLVQEHRHSRPTVPRVAEKAALTFVAGGERALAQSVDGLRFPRWSGRGWRAIGGTTLSVSRRPAATVVYARGKKRITYTIVSGTGQINTDAPPQTHYRGQGSVKFALSWVAVPGPMLTFKRESRTVVMTGTPATDSLVRTTDRLATAR
jgi:anti-sigma factor RsiW